MPMLFMLPKVLKMTSFVFFISWCFFYRLHVNIFTTTVHIMESLLPRGILPSNMTPMFQDRYVRQLSKLQFKNTSLFHISSNTCWNCNLLRPCSKAKGLSAIQWWVYQPRNKTLKTFLNVFVHFICKWWFGINITKVAKQEVFKICVSSSRCSR